MQPHKNYYLMFLSIFNYPETDVGMPWWIMIIRNIWILKNPLREYSPIVISKILPTIYFLFH